MSGELKSDSEGEEDNSQQDDPPDRGEGEANTPQHQGPSSSHHPAKHLRRHPVSWGSECESEDAEKSERMMTQEDYTGEERFSESERSSESESGSSSKDDADDEGTDKESLQLSLPTSQESEVPSANDPTGAEPSTGEAKHGAPEEMKLANDTCMEDMEVALSEVAFTVGDLMPAYSQDTVEVHTPKEEVQNLQ